MRKIGKIYLFSLFYAFCFVFFTNSAQAQYQLTLEQVNKLKVNIWSAQTELQSLKQQLEIANSSAIQSQTDLQNVKTSLISCQTERADYLNRLTIANRQRRNAIIAGVLLGSAIGTGATLSITGAIQRDQAMTYTGLGIASASIVTFIIGTILQLW